MLEGVPSQYPIEVVWEGGKRYRGGSANGPTLLLDGDRQAAPSPVDAVVAAVGACSAIDVVEILAKRRTPVSRLAVRLEFSRAADAPRRLTEVIAHFSVATASARPHVERTVQLAVEKYCSVVGSLAPDTQLAWTLQVLDPDTFEVTG